MSMFLKSVWNKRNAYRRIFTPNSELTPDAQVVLADLRRFCRADQSTVMVSPVTRQVDPLASAVAEGRREVWNRILSHLMIDDKTLFNLMETQNHD